MSTETEVIEEQVKKIMSGIKPLVGSTEWAANSKQIQWVIRKALGLDEKTNFEKVEERFPFIPRDKISDVINFIQEGIEW